MTFYAITIGPIYRVLTGVRYTRELWAASYTFSWLMKHIAADLKSERETLGIEILMPYVDDPHIFGPAVSEKPERYRLGAGLFPDRIIFRKKDDSPQTNDKIFHKTQDSVRAAFKLLAKKIASHFGWSDPSKIETFLDQYFHIYLIEKELADEKNFIGQLGPHLDALELQPSFGATHKPYLDWFFDRVNDSFLVRDGFGTERISFETLIEVACREFEEDEKYQELKTERRGKYGRIELSAEVFEYDTDLPKPLFEERKADRDDDETLVKHLAQRKDFLFPHKYVAIVLSDGDNVGEIIKTLPIENFNDFSKDLHHFALESVEKVKNYGGLPIYAGGDDLLFFAPVIRAKGEEKDHLFRLLTELDEDFKTLFGKYNTTPPPSLSFGVSISFYKYPLAETLESAQTLLFQKAKKEGVKNNLSLEVLKHSGHEFGGTFDLKTDVWLQIRTMLNDRKDWKLIRSIIHKIRESEALFSILAKNEVQLGYFLENSFNEEIHGRKEVKRWLDEVKMLIIKTFQEGGDTKTKFKKLYGALRLISFLNETGSER